MGTFVGIDLGTTFSAVAFINKDGRPEVIVDEEGHRLTPSVVYVGEGRPIVGFEAKEKQGSGATEIASFFKRHMGESNFELEFGGRSFNPIQLSALVLMRLKAVAERHLGESVTHAVITVPAYFNNIEREATIRAGNEAGLQVSSIVNEPTAAALAFGVRPSTGAQTLLVYDLGGGTFDVSVVRITPDEQHVLGTEGDHSLGGKDWDDCILQYLAKGVADEFGKDLLEGDINELLVKAEAAKKALSSRQSVDITVQMAGHRSSYRLTREQFESLTLDLMQRTGRLTEQLLEEIGIGWMDLTNVLLVGGSTRMPMVRIWVEKLLGKPPLTTINPDEAVAMGAAIQAAMDMEQAGTKPMLSLAGRKKSVDAISHSLGMIAIHGDGSRYVNSRIIPKNRPIPACFTRPYRLRVSRRGPGKADVYLTQGETDNPLDCAYLGKYVLSGIPAVSGDEAVLDVTYAYDRNGVVQVSGVERITKQPLVLSIESLPEDVPARFMKPPEAERAPEHLTVYLAFDLSGSMSGDPLREAQKAAHAFLEGCDISATSVGLISFSDAVLVDAKACQNAKTIERAIDGLECGRTGYGNATHPFDEIQRQMKSVEGKRYAVVLADGAWNDQPEAIRKARTCHESGIEVIGVGFGDVDKEFLRQISSSAEQGIFIDMSALAETFSTIAQELTEGGSPGKKGWLRALK
jgi:molecular chaperone DnaK